MIQDEIAIADKVDKWKKLLNANITIEDMHRFHRNIYLITNSSKLRSFKFTLLNYALVLNDYLYDRKIKESNICYFCQEEVKNYIHFFYECDVVSNFIAQVMLVIKEMVPFSYGNLNVNMMNVIFNTVHDNPKNVGNLLILIM